ncbi:hypothetical protein E3O53_07995 [Cryobacterium sp. TMT2-18-3]|uniref:hypothetical protein n=1 Tax=unclassified Cryobacterium TaxID=2649013 RepID=UPI00106BA001|nr:MULTISPECIES: hypothetical protein [unclassified Cryobacterium]TFC26411.1 hypothetical protein E3O22_12310 [Cryobacterium sp. TMT2-18-2]TFC64410.1 hypothetical protein E3O53_07995 [Cryobacterium sp. TMT2-18-3]
MALTPREFAAANPKISKSIGLPASDHYMLFCDDEAGNHWTVIGTDRDYFEMVRDASNEVRTGLEMPADKFPLKRAGWPDEWAS